MIFALKHVLMKKKFLLFAFLLGAIISHSQISFVVTYPESISGGYHFEDAGDWLNNPNMNLPENAIVGELVFARDSILCEPALNADELNGNIAVIYRADCQFGEKVLLAQQAGARAAIIINYDADPVGMAPGDFGSQVTIPAWMVGSGVGSILRAGTSADENVQIFYGNKIGYLDYDVGTYKGDFLVSRFYTIPQVIARNSDDFVVDIGAWVYNFGSVDQNEIQLRADVFGGDSEYSAVSDAFPLESGDSIFVSLPIFGLDEYALDRYNLRYEITSEFEDQFLFDNLYDTYFNVRLENLSLVPSDDEGVPIATTALRAQDNVAFQTCLFYESPIASRLALQGFYFAAGTTLDNTLVDAELLLVAYEWSDPFNSDGTIDFEDLVDIGSQVYIYEENLQLESIYIEAPFPYYLKDNQRYLFCVHTDNSDVFLGFSVETNYEGNINELNYVFPVSLMKGDGPYFGYFTDFYGQPTITPRLVDTAGLSVKKVDLVDAVVFPNPIQDKITIQLKQLDGPAQLVVSDVQGKVILEEEVVIQHGRLELDHPELIKGLYQFELNLANQQISRFKVIVSK